MKQRYKLSDIMIYQQLNIRYPLLYEAAKYGWLDIIKHYINRNPGAHEQYVITKSIKYGHLNIVKYLIEN